MNHYSLYVPVINGYITDDNRDALLDMLKQARTDCVVLTIYGVFDCDLELLHRNIAFFRENGMDVALWVGHTVGHTGAEFSFVEKDLPYQRVLRRDGEPFENTFCAFDPDFQNHIGRKLAEIVRDADLRLVLLDDDCTMTQKGYGCTCPRHLARMQQYLGEPVDRDTLAARVFSGAGSRYRDAWIQAQSDSLEQFCMVLRDHVSRVRPDITVSLCMVMAHWSFDGLDAVSLCQKLSGGNPPFERLHGAPYWSKSTDKSLGYACETARMFASFFKNTGIRTVAEGDVYPRPRTNCSAARLELFDAVMRADGNYNGILKYMISYNREPELERGYVARHAKDLPAFETLQTFFDGGQTTGVRVRMAQHLVRQADLRFARQVYEPEDLSVYSRGVETQSPCAGQIFSVCGIPTTYDAPGICDAIFGENARHFDLQDSGARGVILDTRAAQIYTCAGIDVGLRRVRKTTRERVFRVRECSQLDGDPLVQDDTCQTMISEVELNPGCTPVLFAGTQQTELPLAYTYENAAGTRFLVLTLDGFWLSWDNSPISGSYPMQRMLKKTIGWLARKPLPVTSPIEPNLYVLCSQTEQSLSVLLCNMGEDLLLEPEFTLSSAYDTLACLNCTAQLSGTKLKLTSDIPAFSFAAVKLSR